MATITADDFEYHFKSLYRPLCLFALRYTESADDAEDVVQQAFADVWERSRAGEVIGNIKAYLYMVVRNRSITVISRQNNMETTGQLPDMADLSEEEEIARSERDARLWSAIDSLPNERRRIFLMAKRDGMRYQEIADELHISIKTVENQMGKALRALRDTAIRIYTFFFG